MKAKFKYEVATEFQMSYNTFIKWIKDVPNLNLKKGQKLLSPKQILLIYSYYGNPHLP